MKICYFNLTLLAFCAAIATNASPVLKRKRTCPNEQFCNCNWDIKRIECSCKSTECKETSPHSSNSNSSQTASSLSFANKSLSSFNELYISGIERISRTLFANTVLSSQFRMSMHTPKVIERRSLFNLRGLDSVEIIYNGFKLIEEKAFEGLKCDILSMVSLAKNVPFAVDMLGGSTTRINTLILDYHSSNALEQVFYLRQEEAAQKNTNETTVDLKKWHSNAIVRKMYIQEAKGIRVLDHRWAPKFRELSKIELVYTDIERISSQFTRLHAYTLTFLTIRHSKLELIESNIFEHLVRLKYLDLSSNPIRQIAESAFAGLTTLKVLNLKDIADTYIVDEADMCMLTYLPCGVDVYLDTVASISINTENFLIASSTIANQDEPTTLTQSEPSLSWESLLSPSSTSTSTSRVMTSSLSITGSLEEKLSCVFIYLQQLKHDDSTGIAAFVALAQLSSISSEDLVHRRDNECRINETLVACLEKSRRRSHCLTDTLGIVMSSDFDYQTISSDVTHDQQQELIATNENTTERIHDEATHSSSIDLTGLDNDQEEHEDIEEQNDIKVDLEIDVCIDATIFMNK
jgi:hypothetical protein